MQQYTIWDLLAATSRERLRQLIQNREIKIDEKLSFNLRSPMDPEVLQANLEENLKVFIFYFKVREKIDGIIRKENIAIEQRKLRLKKLQSALRALRERELLAEDLEKIQAEVDRQYARMEAEMMQEADEITKYEAKASEELLAIGTEISNMSDKFNTWVSENFQIEVSTLGKDLESSKYFKYVPEEIKHAYCAQLIEGTEKLNEKAKEEETTYEAMNKEYMQLIKQIAQKKQELGMQQSLANSFTTMKDFTKAKQQSPELINMQERAQALQQKLFDINAAIDACKQEKREYPFTLSENHKIPGFSKASPQERADFVQTYQQHENKNALKNVSLQEINEKIGAYFGKNNRTLAQRQAFMNEPALLNKLPLKKQNTPRAPG